MLIEPSPGEKFRLLLLAADPGGPGLESLRTVWDKESPTLSHVLVPALAHPEPGPSALSTVSGHLVREGKLILLLV